MKKTKLLKSITTCLLASVISFGSLGVNSYAASSPTVWYRSHVENIGWMSTVTNGSTSGTTGRGLQLEGTEIDLSGVNGGVIYRSHVQDLGWLDWVSNRTTSGTIGRALASEAIEIKLTGQAAKDYDIVYRAHVAELGWLPWVSNGETAGTVGQARQMEAIEIKLVAKSSNSTISSPAHSSILGNAKVQSFLNDSRWKVGTAFTNSVTGKLPQTKNKGWGCNAYARDFAQYVYNKDLRNGTKYTNISELRAGDTVYVTPQHWMVILERNGKTVKVVHGNWTGGKVCQSTFNINGNKIGDRTFSYGYHY